MGLLALVCLFIIACMVPGEIWAALFYLAFLALVAFVGFWAFVIWLAETA